MGNLRVSTYNSGVVNYDRIVLYKSDDRFGEILKSCAKN